MRRRDSGRSRAVGDATCDVSDGHSLAGRFLAGLSIGALVGAAIAGSAIWDRWRRSGDEGRTEEHLDGASNPDASAQSVPPRLMAFDELPGQHVRD